MTALEADLSRAVAAIVQSAKDLKSEDSQLRIEVGTVHTEVGIERQITRDLVTALHKRQDDADRLALERHNAVMTAIKALGGRNG